MKNTDVLIKFIDFLMAKNIYYALLGNIDGLPFNITSDIDITLDFNKPKELPLFIQEFANKEKIHLIQILQHEWVAYYFVLVWFDTNGKINFLHPDICTDYYRQGIKFINNNILLNNSEELVNKYNQEKGLIIPKVDIRFIYYLIKRIDKKDIQESHFNSMSKEWKIDRKSCLVNLYKYWSKTDCQIFINAFDENSLSTIVDNIEYLSNRLRKRVKISILDRLLNYQRIFHRIIHPTGLFIVFLGPDGCGKSTIIQEISNDLSPAFRKVDCQHLRPKIGFNKKSGISIKDPHAKPNYNCITSIVKIFYFLFDYTFGYYFSIRNKMVKSTLVIFDRYYYDILVDPKRYRYGGPPFLSRIISKLIPSPDLVILLDAPADILQSRKQEVSFSETAQQRQAYLKLIKKMPNGVVIDASNSLPKVVHNVNKTVITYMEKRVRKYFGI